jgi:hypothetical protein
MRRTPYTATGIKRARCFKCNGPGHAQWQICADGNQYRVICKKHDVELNTMVMRWAFGKAAESKIQAYKTEVTA